MLGPNKWRLLTIVAGILLAHAIDSPVRVPRTTLVQHQQYPSSVSNVRNLYRPYQIFSNVDTVRYVDRQYPANERTARQAFGSFRYTDSSRRRSDIRLNHTEDAAAAAATTKSPTRLRPVFIPLNQETKPSITKSESTPISLNTTIIEEIQSRTDANIFTESTNRQQIKFPDSSAVAAAALPLRSADDITGRRSGIQFTAQSQKFKNVFQPQGYREDNPDSANYQFPYSEELSSSAFDDLRYTRGVAAAAAAPITAQQQDKLQKVESNAGVRFDDVTKFGDVNGPVTATLQQRQYSEYIDRPYDGRSAYDSGSYYSSPYDEYSRSPRYYTAPKAAYVEYSDYPGPPRSRLITPWKSARSPRVVFPQAGDVFPSGAASVAPVSASGSAATSYNSDNVVFR